MNNSISSIQCKDDQELLEFLLCYLTESPYNQLILYSYPDGQKLTASMLAFNVSMAESQGLVPVMAYRTCKQYYRSFNSTTGLTALIPVDLVDH